MFCSIRPGYYNSKAGHGQTEASSLWQKGEEYKNVIAAENKTAPVRMTAPSSKPAKRTRSQTSFRIRHRSLLVLSWKTSWKWYVPSKHHQSRHSHEITKSHHNFTVSKVREAVHALQKLWGLSEPDSWQVCPILGLILSLLNFSLSHSVTWWWAWRSYTRTFSGCLLTSGFICFLITHSSILLGYECLCPPLTAPDSHVRSLKSHMMVLEDGALATWLGREGAALTNRISALIK